MTEDKKEAITESNEVGENNESLKEKKIEIASKNPLIFDSDSNTSHPEKNSNEDDLNDTIDFSTLVSKGKNFFKRKKSPKLESKSYSEKPSHKQHQKAHHETHHSPHHDNPNKSNTHKKEEVDQPIDFSALKNKAKNLFKSDNSKPSNDDVSFDLKKVTLFTKKNASWIIPLILILIAIILSSSLRMAPSSLPVTDDWAENTVHNFYRNNIVNQIAQQYPNLPQANREALVNKEFKNFLEQNKEQVDRDLKQVSEQYKSNFKDENGDTYLLAIDPYLWWGEARNVVNHGHLGDKIVDGESIYSLRNGRQGLTTSTQAHPYFGAYLYKFLSIFTDISIMRAMFLLPVILIGLALIPTFFIGRRIAGNVGGFFSAMFLALNGPLLSRTPAGFADTDPYNVFFPLFIAWLFIEAYLHKKTIWRWGLGIVAGFLTGVYAATWSGWSSIFLFVLVATIIALGYHLASEFKKNKYKFKISSLKVIKSKILALVIYFVSSGVFVTFFENFLEFTRSFMRPINFINIKEVGLKNIWPNVLTTVAEFNTQSFSNIIGQAGGNLLFWMGLMGITFLLIGKKTTKNTLYLAGTAVYYLIALNLKDQLNNPLTFVIILAIPIVLGLLKTVYFEENIEPIYPIFLILWLLGTAYAFTKGIRFAQLVAPAISISLGVALGIFYKEVSEWLRKAINLNKRISQILIIVVLCLLLITPYSSAQGISKSQVPSMNDVWYDALTKIKDDSARSIITSWWDFGHWFVAVAERSVTFDGANQKRRIHWVGKSLISDSEAESIGVLRMLNCVQEDAPDKLDEFTGNTLKSVNMLYQIFPINDRNQAYKKYLDLGLTKEQAVVMLEQTHCKDLLDNYYITSEDMVGKAGVWGHFGSWDFTKADMYQATNKMNRAEAVTYLVKTFGLSEEEANKIHSEIQSNKGDQWISPWPGFISGPQGCQKNNNVLKCEGSIQGNNIGFMVNLDTYDTEIINNPELKPNSIVYPTKEGIIEKKFNGSSIGFSFIIVPNGDSYHFITADPLQASSTFAKLFFLNGHGMKCFSKFDDRQQFTGGRIATWKIDWDCQQENNVYFKPKEMVQASHILISSQERGEEEALKMITAIAKEVNTENFANLAKDFSEDPGSKENGGSLDWFEKGQMVPEFEEVAFSLEKGVISEPVKTQFGYHLILVKDKKLE